MNYSIFDMEGDGLLDTITKIYCLSVEEYVDNKLFRNYTLTDYNDMRRFFLRADVICGHNIILFDIPVAEKILGVKPVASIIIDTLALSWYLYPKEEVHGLEAWGVRLGIAKPVISDWQNLTIGEYIYRCTEDVKINKLAFDLFSNYLFEIYKEKDKVLRLVGYLRFKLECAREMEEEQWKLDVETCIRNLKKLEDERIVKTENLSNAMPEKIHYKLHARPKVMYKKNGEISLLGEKWLELLRLQGLPEYHIGTVKLECGRERGNPGSVQQLKAWLFSLGWEPDLYKQVKDTNEDTGIVTIREVPQISVENAPDLTDSVKELFEKEPKLEYLEGVFTLRHRIGILKGFLENKDEHDFLKAQIAGLTNTLRFKHKTIVNLPTIPKPYWEEVRSCLIASDDEHILCGSDMSGLEDTTKRHFMYYFDPEYVKKIMNKEYDPHIDVAVRAELLTELEGAEHLLYDSTKGEQGKSYKAIRLVAKKGNFACVYGAGAAKLARTMKITIPKAKIFHKAYWGLNWSVKAVSDSCIVKEVRGQLWLYNPISQFYYCLRMDKDRFSTLNQGCGVYCFDSWVRNQRKQGIRICGQFHDETISNIKKGTEEEHKQKLLNAIKWTNEELKLNLELGISIDFGHSYKDIH